jgi:broad specificity phosphatase PhoE/uncharacterized membrane protein YgcG
LYTNTNTNTVYKNIVPRDISTCNDQPIAINDTIRPSIMENNTGTLSTKQLYIVIHCQLIPLPPHAPPTMKSNTNTATIIMKTPVDKAFALLIAGTNDNTIRAMLIKECGLSMVKAHKTLREAKKKRKEGTINQVNVHACTLLPDTDHAVQQAKIAFNGGADGIFLILHAENTTVAQLNTLYAATRQVFPDRFIGLNYLGIDPTKVIDRLPDDLDGLWIDSGICGHGLDMQVLHAMHALQEKEKLTKYHVQVFGAFAFKYQLPMSPLQLLKWVPFATALFDVITTSGSGTGQAIEQAKADAVKSVSQGKALLGCASGVNIENIHRLLGTFDVFVVASSVEDGNEYSGILNPTKIEELACEIKSYDGGGGVGGSSGGSSSGGSGGGSGDGGSGVGGCRNDESGETKTETSAGGSGNCDESKATLVTERLKQSNIPRVWLGSNGRKSHFDNETSNFRWLLKDEQEVKEIAKELFDNIGVRPSRIISSPFYRTIQTACVYATHLGLTSISIEPGLCEVLTPSLGCRMPSSSCVVPTWTNDELQKLVESYGVSIDETHVPVVPYTELRMEANETSRTEIEKRMHLLCHHTSTLEGAPLIVTHERAVKIMLRILQKDQQNDNEVPLGSVTELAKGPPCMHSNSWIALRQTYLIEPFVFSEEKKTTNTSMPHEILFLLDQMQSRTLPFYVDTKWCPHPNFEGKTYVEQILKNTEWWKGWIQAYPDA